MRLALAAALALLAACSTDVTRAPPQRTGPTDLVPETAPGGVPDVLHPGGTLHVRPPLGDVFAPWYRCDPAPYPCIPAMP